MANPTVTPITEALHSGGFIVSEANGHRSRDAVTLLTGSAYLAGTVLGKVTLGAGSSAAGTNTGNGVMGAITVGARAIPGVYKLTVTKAAGNAGDFEVVDPNNEVCGVGTVAVAFAGGGIAFTLADGTNDFIVGDTFIITVAAGSGKYTFFDPTKSDGTQNALAILYGPVDATNADRAGTVMARSCEINSSELIWGTGVTTTPQKTAALAQLAALGIISR